MTKVACKCDETVIESIIYDLFAFSSIYSIVKESNELGSDSRTVRADVYECDEVCLYSAFKPEEILSPSTKNTVT